MAEVLVDKSIVSVSYLDSSVLSRITSIEIVLMQFAEKMVGVGNSWPLGLIDCV